MDGHAKNRIDWRNPMKTISKEELKAKLDRGESFKLVMTMDPNAFEWAHIPGSININDMQEAVSKLDLDEEVVIYCSSPFCNASFRAYYTLRSLGFKNLRRYSGGLQDWYEAGYPLEGKMALELEFSRN
jgi:rhodanese-related sulfurtransferase